jgi:hypothetical protein
LSVDSGHLYPSPETDTVWVSSPDTEGELAGNKRPQNRTITVVLQIDEPLDAAATNLCTNPVFATGTTGYTNVSLVTFTAGVYRRLDPTLPFLPGFDTALHAVGNAAADSVSFALPVTVATPVVFSAWVYVVSGLVRLEAWNATPAPVTTGLDIPAGSWQRVSLLVTPTSTATWTFRVAQDGAGAANWWMTGIQLGPLDPYFDGDMPGCFWNGPRHASTSTRRGTGGDRYDGIRTAVENKIAKLDRYGGVYRRVLPTGRGITFDVRQARLVSWQEEVSAEFGRFIRCQAEFTCNPYGRGDEVIV